MNILDHILAGHYPTDDKGRALVRMGSGDAVAVICASDKPGRYPILGWAPTQARAQSIEFAWDALGNAAGYHSIRYTFVDRSKADVAYAAITKAMADYKEFSNKDDQTVAVQGDAGEATFRVSQLVSVTIEDVEAARPFSEAIIRQNAMYRRRELEIEAEVNPTADASKATTEA